MTKRTVESNWNQVLDDEWEVEDTDSLIEKFSDWVDSQIDNEKKIRSDKKDGKLFIRIDDIVITNPDDPDQLDLLMTINRVESPEDTNPF